MQVDQRGLARAGRPDERDGLPGNGVQGDVLEHGPVLVVGEADVGEASHRPVMSHWPPRASVSKAWASSAASGGGVDDLEDPVARRPA